MCDYKLNNILNKFTKRYPSEQINYNPYIAFAQRHVKINKPDFIALIDIKAVKPVIYSKNISLKFEKDQNESIHDIMKCVDQKQIDKILEADKLTIDFVTQNMSIIDYAMFQLRFTVSLIKGDSRSFLRNISFIKRNSDKPNEMLLLTTITDVTNLIALEKHVTFSIKGIHKECEDQGLHNKVMDLIQFMNGSVLSSKINLTKRERQILELISKGETSNSISDKLYISINTVNTHRQNLIKKFGVANTASLLTLL